ncbi:MAG TPA: M23 family metallopeptidase [Gemmatimonadaceae bacterium]|jgi:murein DD-endopeptidase MepM/ murein hydrolase activator NlpD
MPRRWTILIVPDGTDSPRSFVLGERRLRVLVGVAVALLLLIGSAAAVLFTPWATPSARMAARENERLKQELASIDGRLQALVDTIAQIEQQDQRIRTLAGIDPDSTGEVAQKELATADAGTITEGAVPAKPMGLAPEKPQRFASRPFLGRLGFGGSRPDLEGMIRRASELSASFRAVSDTLVLHAERMANLPSIMPTAGWLTSQFSKSRFHPILHVSRAHEGVDVVAPMGAPIVAPAAGRVIKAGREQGYGLMVQIDHGNGLVSIYAHASKLMASVGQRVVRGQMIARVGNSGLSTGPHLHYEIMRNGKPMDPLTFVMPAGKITD